jgi:hypothetical protein
MSKRVSCYAKEEQGILISPYAWTQVTSHGFRNTIRKSYSLIW